MLGDKFNFGHLGALMKNAGKIESVMKEAQNKLASITVIGEAGAGAVKITMNAQHYVKDISIDDEIFKEEKIVLQELIVAALNDAAKKVEKEKEKLMSASNLIGDILNQVKEEKSE